MALLRMIARGGHRWATLCRWVAVLGACAALGQAAPEATKPAQPSAEYQLKAVFLFNFAQFVEWPAPAFRGTDTPLVIGILGDDPFGTYLDELVGGEKVGARPLAIRRYKQVKEIEECHILFVSGSEVGGLDGILAGLKGRSVLTVSDAEVFTRRGGMVRFVMENGKIRLRINLEAATASDLTISSKLLRAATIVKAGKD